MTTAQQLCTLFLILLSFEIGAAHLPDDVEPGDSINEISLPLTSQSAAELIHLETHGKVLSVDTKQHKGKSIFRIKVLHEDGTVKFYRVDPMTGHPPK